METSSDGRELYVYSCSGCTGEFRMGNGGDHWLQVFDAASGENLRNVPTPTCSENRDMGVQPHVTPDGGTLFVVCLETGRVSAVGLSDGDGLFNVAVIDTASGDVTRQRSVLNAEVTSRLLPLVAVSEDGNRLFVAIDDQPEDMEATAHVLYIFDTETLQPAGEIDLDITIDAPPPASALEDSSLFALGRATTPENMFRQTILRITSEGSHEQIAALDREEVLVMISGSIPPLP